MRVLPGVVRDDDTGDMDLVGLKELGDAELVLLVVGGNAVVAHHGEGEHEDLLLAGGIREGLGVADHRSVEDDLAVRGDLVTEGEARRDRRAARKADTPRGQCRRQG